MAFTGSNGFNACIATPVDIVLVKLIISSEPPQMLCTYASSIKAVPKAIYIYTASVTTKHIQCTCIMYVFKFYLTYDF